MKKRTILIGLFLLLAAATLLYAAQKTVKLTTYYPAPYGEYNQINTNSAKFTPQSGDPDVPDGAFASPQAADEGKLVYSSAKDAFYYYNGSSWVSQGGGGITSVTVYGTQACPTVTGFTATLVYPGWVTVWQEYHDTGTGTGAGGAGGFCSNASIADSGGAWGLQGWWGQSERRRVDSESTRYECCVCIYSK